MCHFNCHVHIYGILPKKIIKTSEKACQNYYNYNLITDVFQPYLFGHAKALVKGASKYPGKKFTFPREKNDWNKSDITRIFTQKLALFG